VAKARDSLSFSARHSARGSASVEKNMVDNNKQKMVMRWLGLDKLTIKVKALPII
jgi:hypothetical protein